MSFISKYFWIPAFAGMLLWGPVTMAQNAEDPTYERRVVLAEEMHQIWPTRLKVENAINKASEKLPYNERSAFKAAMRKAVKFEVLEEESVRAMVKLFTVEELEEMVEFYGSSSGRSISAKIEAYQYEIGPAFTKMLDQALMDMRTGSAPGQMP